jgi:GNAT superfamily N-acetyltransferase
VSKDKLIVIVPGTVPVRDLWSMPHNGRPPHGPRTPPRVSDLGPPNLGPQEECNPRIISNILGSDGLPFSVRSYVPGDRNLILHSWIQNAQRFSRLRAGYARAAEERIKELLGGAGRCLVACSQREPGRVFGWAVAQGPVGGGVLHFVYVKRALRRQGIGGALLRALGLDKRPVCVSHWTWSEEPDPEQFIYVGFP